MEQFIGKTISEIALAEPSTTRVFEEFKIDYCCGGRRSIADACTAAGVDVTMLMDRLEANVIEYGSRGDLVHPEDLGPTQLIDHIIAEHHIFTAQELARLGPLMEKVVTRHGELHPELFELAEIFDELVVSLIPHMQKEEMVLFPFIRELDAAAKAGLAAPVPHFGTVQNPIRMMMSEHDVDGDRLAKMRVLTNGYKLPDGACPTFTALYAGLEDLEKDLHRHIHLENNVLFPAAAAMEG